MELAAITGALCWEGTLLGGGIETAGSLLAGGVMCRPCDLGEERLV